jgi:hypothetical protein
MERPKSCTTTRPPRRKHVLSCEKEPETNALVNIPFWCKEKNEKKEKIQKSLKHREQQKG